jgi:hypothetical protein
VRHVGRVKIVGQLAKVVMVLVVISPSCSGQTSNPPKTLSENQTSSFTGCYELVLGKWCPWSFGEDTVFVTPPTRIELLPEPGTKGFDKNGFLIRAIPRQTSVSPGRPVSSYRQIKSSTHVELVWTNDLSGVTLELSKQGTELRGWAHPHFDFRTFPPRIQHVTAKLIGCEVSQ